MRGSVVAGMDFTDEAYVKRTVTCMFVSFLTYLIAYKLIRRKIPSQGPEYCCRIPTFIHGIISTLAGLYFVVLPHLGYVKAELTILPGSLILTHSMGYFVFDLLWCFVHGEHPIMKFHHILTVTGLFYFSFKITRHSYNIFALFLSELTNPLLQVRWFLKHHGLRSGLAFKFVEVAFITSFFLIRVFIMSYYLYRSWLDPSLGMDGIDLTFITLGSATSYALAIQMFNYICYQFSKSSKHQKAE